MDTNTKTERKTCTIKKNILVDAHVEAKMPEPWRRYYFQECSPEEHAKRLKDAVNEFIDFLRDHRSQDLIELDVVEDRKDLCSACNAPYEDAIDEETKEHFCASCGATLVEEKKPQ